MDESRRQFEEWLNTSGLNKFVDMRICKNSDGDYMAWDMQLAFRAWQASRQVVELNIPSACKDDSYFFEGTFQPLRYERDVERALSAAGLKIKEVP